MRGMYAEVVEIELVSKDEWIEALRNEKGGKAINRYRDRDFDGQFIHCTFGKLIDVAVCKNPGKLHWDGEPGDGIAVGGPTGVTMLDQLVPPDVTSMFEIPVTLLGDDPDAYDESYVNISDVNDSTELTLPEIADLMEEAYVMAQQGDK